MTAETKNHVAPNKFSDCSTRTPATARASALPHARGHANDTRSQIACAWSANAQLVQHHNLQNRPYWADFNLNINTIICLDSNNNNNQHFRPLKRLTLLNKV